MCIFADEMEMQQEKIMTRAKQTGRRLIDGLFGSRNTRKQQEEELEQLLQEHARLVEEREYRQRFIDSISRGAAASVSRLSEDIQKLILQDASSDSQRLYAAMTDETKHLTALIQQLHTPEEGDDETDEGTAGSGSQPSSQLKRPVIVLATDNDERGLHLKAALSTLYEIRHCHSGWQALAAVYSNGADAILADAEMKSMDGLTMCSRLRSNPQTSLIPVILMSDDGQLRLQGLQHGADLCVAASTEAEAITCSVSSLLKRRRQLLLSYEQQRRAEQHDEPVQKKKTANEKLMERVMDTIHKNLKDSSLSVDMVADEVGMSRVHLHRKMKEIVGQTPHDFIRQQRLERAARLLAAGDMNIAEVVYACGFPNAASFSTTFKNVYGLTPKEYMTQLSHG